LRVLVVAPSSMYGRMKIGDVATIIPELVNASPVSARVILIDKVLDSASNTFRITLRLPNPGYTLPAGLRCRADFKLEGAAGKSETNPRADKSKGPAGTPAAR
jgi:cobalt-zinc-cadmium efflux system membrane fusion protein